MSLQETARSVLPSGHDLWRTWCTWAADPTETEEEIMAAVLRAKERLLAAAAKFEPSPEDFAVLTRHYLDRAMDLEHFWVASGDGISSSEMRRSMFYFNKMRALAAAMGEEAFYAAIAKVREKWERIFTLWAEEERACPNFGREMHAHMDCICERDGVNWIDPEDPATWRAKKD